MNDTKDVVKPNLQWMRTCQSCGHQQRDTRPAYGDQSFDAYRDRRCRSCRSSDLDYGSEQDTSAKE